MGRTRNTIIHNVYFTHPILAELSYMLLSPSSRTLARLDLNKSTGSVIPNLAFLEWAA
jgi:hypothetical protein